MGLRRWTVPAWWLSLFVLYSLFVGKLSWQEVGAAAVSSGLAVVSMRITRDAACLRYRFRLRWIAKLARIPWAVVRDTGVVLAALGRRVAGRCVEGSYVSVPFEAGEADAESAARRALVAAAKTMPPNSIVVSVEPEERLMLVHQLVPASSGRPRDDRWPL